MFLKYLQIVNYKNLRSARFSFVEGVNTVIGENDSGKSNAMTALRILLDDTYYYNTKRLKENDFSDSLEIGKDIGLFSQQYLEKLLLKTKKQRFVLELYQKMRMKSF